MARLTPIDSPAFGEALPAVHASHDTHRLLRLRRSSPADKLVEPGPDRVELDEILQIAARVPDHRCVTPFRFIVFGGASRKLGGKVLAEAFTLMRPDAEEKAIELERRRFERAPVVIAVVSSVDRSHKTPEWEQVLTVGAVCYNILLAANSLGYAGQWLTEWYAYDDIVKAGFGLSSDERFAGFIYVGTASEDPLERKRPDVDSRTRYY